MITTTGSMTAGSLESTTESREPYCDKSLFRDTVLRSTLPGEYVAIGLSGYAVFSAFVWCLFFPQSSLSLVMTGCSLWIAFRVSGTCSGEYWAFLISGLLLVMVGMLATVGISNVPPWMSTGLVSPIVCTMLMACISVVDYLDWQLVARSLRTAAQNRKAIRHHLLVAFVGLFLAWSIGVPFGSFLYQWNNPPVPGKFRGQDLGLIGNIGLRFSEAIFTAWFFAIGATIGSFLNVVIWRMPNGKSIVYAKSRCPACDVAILGRDNIPILGWFGLGGRCRNCNVEISARYPIVEAIVSGLFLMLYFVELISGGANLPIRSVNSYTGVLWIVLYTKWDLVGLYLYHCFLFCTLLTWVLMTKDGNRVPIRLILFSFLIAIAAPIAFPNLCLVPVWKSTPDWMSGWVGIAMHGVMGSLIGSIAGFAAYRLLRLVFQKTDNLESIVVLMPSFAGCVLGWQAVLAATVIFFMVTILTSCCLNPMKTLSSWMMATAFGIAVLLHHITWRMQWVSLYS